MILPTMKSSVTHQFYKYYLNYLKLKEVINVREKGYSADFDKIKRSFYKKLWADTARDLGAKIQDFGYGYYKIQLGSRSTFVQDHSVMLDDHVTLRIAGNKPLVNKILSEYHFPIVKYVEYDLNSIDTAFKFINRMNRPGVVKPAQSGAAGKGITTGINSWRSLFKASFRAAIFSNKLIIEEQADGISHKLLYLNGQYLDAIKINLPQISGDGKSTIKKLIEHENFKRMRGEEIISLHPLTIDLELKSFIKSQGYNLTDVLPEHQTLSIKRVSNQNSCYENESVRTAVHPDTVEIGSKIVKILNMKLASIDIIAKDITKPLSEINGVINEVNTTPGFHHHYLISNKADTTPVALHVLKFLLNPKKHIPLIH